MDVILDTNIFQSDFSLNGPRFEALSAYLKKSEDQLIIPHIVAEELKLNYKSSLKRTLKEISVANRELGKVVSSKTLSDLNKVIEDSILTEIDDVLITAEHYIKSVQSKIVHVKLLGKGNYDIDNLSIKALSKKKPFNENGSGFKDALIWQDLLNYCETTESRQVIFISNNSRDFGKDVLHADLVDEAVDRGLTILYYNNLDQFIDARFKSLESLNVTPEDIDQESLQILVGYWLRASPQGPRAYLAFKSTQLKKYAGYIGLHYIEVKEIKEFTVKDVELEYKYIHGTMECNISLAAATVSYDYDGVDVAHTTGIEVVETEALIVFSMKYDGNKFDDLEIVEVLFP